MKVHYGNRLAEERVRLGLSQSDMAEKGGVSARTYAYYESGEREPPFNASPVRPYRSSLRACGGRSLSSA
ncbi:MULTISPECIES: helix-turn-helix transcriptional regulator [Ralstonia]|uniref:helix-turn-helix transcriptional regulator n=1 Tax=Ralstonia TaxID=48736 RepID=UPI00055D8250|nr:MULTISPECIES: helix-turn-helix transcriptional regulator [Ralstonia]